MRLIGVFVMLGAIEGEIVGVGMGGGRVAVGWLDPKNAASFPLTIWVEKASKLSTPFNKAVFITEPLSVALYKFV